jgi:threonine dehydratase
MEYTLSREDFREARSTLVGRVHRTPLLGSRALGDRAGGAVWLKTENLQKTGSFKPRGAFNRVRRLAPADRARGVITASAGNHGQALAYVARAEGVQGVVVMPAGANPSKVAAVREYGAEAVLHGAAWDDAYARSLELARERGLIHVHPFKDRHIMAGQGTVACEILEDLAEVATVLVPIGGGGLLAGMAMALREHGPPRLRIVGVEPEGSANMQRSRAAGRAVELEAVATIADGLATRKTDPEVFGIIDRLVDDLVTVSDAEIVRAIRFLLERTKLVAEPSGAAAVAALLARKVPVAGGGPAVVVLSGGNLDIEGRVKLEY